VLATVADQSDNQRRTHDGFATRARSDARSKPAGVRGDASPVAAGASQPVARQLASDDHVEWAAVPNDRKVRVTSRNSRQSYGGGERSSASRRSASSASSRVGIPGSHEGSGKYCLASAGDRNRQHRQLVPQNGNKRRWFGVTQNVTDGVKTPDSQKPRDEKAPRRAQYARWRSSASRDERPQAVSQGRIASEEKRRRSAEKRPP